MKRGLTTLLATVAFLAGHVAARACLATMSLSAPQETPAAPSCCHKHVPESSKAPAPKDCCCADGVNLALTDEPVQAAPAESAGLPEITLAMPEPVSPSSHAGGREPPRILEKIPHYTLFASLLI